MPRGIKEPYKYTRYISYDEPILINKGSTKEGPSYIRKLKG